MVAVDAGPMQIQLCEEAVLSRAETVLQGTTHDTVGAEIGYGEKVSRRLSSKKLEEGIALTASHKDTERPEGRRVFELERVVSCRNADPWWRSKLDFDSRQPLDDLHWAATLGSAKDQVRLQWKQRVVQLAALGLSPATESKAAEAWYAAGWPESRNAGCARSLAEGCAVRSDTGTRRPIEAATSVCCGQRNHASER